jgi:hypothetical protein
MFLKPPKASTDQRVRSLLQKAARRGFARVVELALTWLDHAGDKAWLRSRAVVITFEECWPHAANLRIDPNLSTKKEALLRVTRAAKQKDAAGLGALAHAYHEGDESMLNWVPDRRLLKLVSEALKRPQSFFDWILAESKTKQALDAAKAAQRYLPAATWPWDKACIIAGALLASRDEIPVIEAPNTASDDFPYWVALDKHTPDGKVVLTDISKQLNSSYRQLIWASFYLESAQVNRLLPSPWWNAERTWRLHRAGLTLEAAQELWLRAGPLVRERLEDKADALKQLIETPLHIASSQRELLC